MIPGNHSSGLWRYFSWAQLCLISGIVISGLPDLVYKWERLHSLFPSEVALRFFDGFADGFSLVLIVLSIFLNLSALRRYGAGRKGRA